MEVLLLTFANSRTNPLPTLAGEYAELSKRLWPRALRQHYLACPVSHATLDDVAYYLTLFRDRLSLFLYSGHAGRDELLTEDGASRAAGIAHLLGQCKNLKVVILNGCSTAGQVAALHRAGVPLVIATSAPVGDDIAAQFSQRLFQALEAGLSIGEAFEQGIGEALGRRPLDVERGAGFAATVQPGEPLWGIQPHPDKPDAGGWKLPVAPVKAATRHSEPNEVLLETLYETLAASNPRVRALRDSGATLDSRKRRDIKNTLEDAFPAPISEHLRRLLNVSLPDESNGYDKPGPKRLEQLARTYQIAMDFLAYVLLAQLWEVFLRAPRPPDMDRGLQTRLRDFLRLGPAERRACDHFSILSQLTSFFETRHTELFLPELIGLYHELQREEAVKNACYFLETLLRRPDFAGVADWAEHCARAEESLALLFGKLGFLGQYFVATVRNIGVVKPRHTRKAEFEHLVVVWHGTQGDCESDTLLHPEFMDNRSVVLLRLGEQPDEAPLLSPDETADNRFLNLSPFILDENTFEAVPSTTLSKLYFYAGHEDGRQLYKYVNTPDSDVIDLEDPRFFDKKPGASKFRPAIVQFDEFFKTVLNQTPNPAAP